MQLFMLRIFLLLISVHHGAGLNLSTTPSMLHDCVTSIVLDVSDVVVFFCIIEEAVLYFILLFKHLFLSRVSEYVSLGLLIQPLHLRPVLLL